MRTGFFLLLLSFPGPTRLVAQDIPLVEGYVTTVAPDGHFDAVGAHVVLGPKVKLFRVEGKTRQPVTQLDPVFLGQGMSVWGRFDKKTFTITATRIDQAAPSIAQVRGGAMIDLAPPTEDPSTRTVRADGYLLHFTPDSTVAFNAPYTSLADITTNVWIEYKGTQQLDGTVNVDHAEFWPNAVYAAEDKLRKKKEYDPGAISNSDKQSGTSKFFRGTDARKLPAHHDVALQARVDRVGQSLIPAYQKALAATDPGKINFRFQVVETNTFNAGVDFANGIILIPWPAVDRLQNDSQLAALLADNIACTLEKQEILHQPTLHALNLVSYTGLVGGVFVPGLGIGTGLVTGGIESHYRTLRIQQSSRVSLTYMKDAGYDLNQAPVAWWLLDSRKPQPLLETVIPDRANYLYSALGTTWRQAPAGSF